MLTLDFPRHLRSVVSVYSHPQRSARRCQVKHVYHTIDQSFRSNVRCLPNASFSFPELAATAPCDPVDVYGPRWYGDICRLVWRNIDGVIVRGSDPMNIVVCLPDFSLVRPNSRLCVVWIGFRTPFFGGFWQWCNSTFPMSQDVIRPANRRSVRRIHIRGSEYLRVLGSRWLQCLVRRRPALSRKLKIMRLHGEGLPFQGWCGRSIDWYLRT